MAPPDSERRLWKALVLEVPDGLDGDLTARLGSFAIGSESSPAAEGRSLLRIFLHQPGVEAEARAALEGTLRDSSIDPGECNIRAESIVDGYWVEKYQASLKPFRIGSRFEVHPAGERSGESNLVPLLLLPGRAFGTGEHATTRLCAELLERHVRPGSSWLDLGCGSALLAMIAYHCGAARITALDNDPEAIEVAREVLEGNGLSNAVDLRLGTLEESGPATWSGIVANIIGFFSASTTELLYAMLEPGGSLIASGFTPQESEETEQRLLDAGFRTVGRGSEGEWAVIHASRPGGGGR